VDGVLFATNHHLFIIFGELVPFRSAEFGPAGGLHSFAPSDFGDGKSFNYYKGNVHVINSLPFCLFVPSVSCVDVVQMVSDKW
jgi:hypothetical protein